MKYELTDYQNKKIIIDASKAKKLASVAGLIEVEINGQIHYLNKTNIASIIPQVISSSYKTPSELGMPDLGGDNE